MMHLYVILIGLYCATHMADVPATPASATVAAPDIATQAQDSLQVASSKSSKRKTKEKKERLPVAATITSIRNVTRASMMHRSTDGYYTSWSTWIMA